MARFSLIIIVLLFIAAGMHAPERLWADSFQIIAAETPMVSGGGQGIRRYVVYETFGQTYTINPIPGTAVNDPAGLALRNDAELFVGNRAAHSGLGTISKFILQGNHFAYDSTLSGNDITDCHQLAFDPVSGELFQTNWTSGKLSRFLFDSSGNAIPNGVVIMPDTKYQLGVAIRPGDQQLFVSDYTLIRRFRRETDGSYTFLGTFSQGSNEMYHSMKFCSDELYIAAFYTNRVLRYRFNLLGEPLFKDAFAAAGAVDLAFSPDQQEMFVTNHRDGGIMRYQYHADTDTWSPYGETIPTPMLGGIVITTTSCPYKADLTGDCQVNLQDLAVFAGQWLDTADPAYCPLSADLAEDDCHVNLADYAFLASQWLQGL